MPSSPRLSPSSSVFSSSRPLRPEEAWSKADSPVGDEEPADVSAGLLPIISERSWLLRGVPRTGRKQTSPLALKPRAGQPHLDPQVMEEAILESQEGGKASGSGQRIYEGEIVRNHPGSLPQCQGQLQGRAVGDGLRRWTPFPTHPAGRRADEGQAMRCPVLAVPGSVPGC